VSRIISHVSGIFYLQLLVDYTFQSFVHMPSAKYTNETLVRHGSIGASPEKVTVAISIRTLECYRQVHRACPRLSIHAYSKALCNLHNVRELFSFVWNVEFMGGGVI